jgi:hypothetical protein
VTTLADMIRIGRTEFEPELAAAGMNPDDENDEEEISDDDD